MCDDYQAVSYTTNKEIVIKVYIKKRKIWLNEKDLAILCDKPVESIRKILFNITGNRKFKKNYVNYKGNVLYDIKIIEEVGKILENKNALLLKYYIKEHKKENDINYEGTGWRFLEVILEIISDILLD
jgi:hypothetical protein